MDIVSLGRRAGIALGTIALGLGIVFLFAPGQAAAVPVTVLVVDVAAVVAVVLGLWAVRQRLKGGSRRISVPDVEFRLATPTPGDEIDEKVYRMTELREGTLEYREQIYERVRDVAVSVLRQRRDCSREEAEGLLERGEWTADDHAAAFLTSRGSGGGGQSLVTQVVDRFTDRESAYEQQLRATAGEIEALAGYSDEPGTDRTGNSGDSEGPDAMASDVFSRDVEANRVADDVLYFGTLTTGHWSGIAAFSLFALAVGLLTSQPAILLASALGVGLAGYARVGTPPALTNLAVTRTVSDESPEPGAEIDVSVTVENEGSSFMPDLSFVDRVPPTMSVVEGSPRLGTALRPGGRASFSYRVRVTRGEHDWPLQVIGRDLSGSAEREAEIEPETPVSCAPRLETVVDAPVRLQTSVYEGEVKTKTGGSGLEFFSLRDYQPGDPESRINWKEFARTGEFTTIDFREERAARVVLLFDCRESSYVSSTPGEMDALNRSIEAAYDVFASLTDQGHLVGLAAYNGVPCWLGPSTGSMHRQRAREVFAEHPAMSALPPSLAAKDEGRYVDPMVHIRRQLPSNTQLFLFSPLADDYTHEVARRLHSSGHLVTVISPNPTAGRTPGQRVARLERRVRVRRLRDHGIRVVDWETDESLGLALEYARKRWQA